MDDNKYETYDAQPKTMQECRNKISKINRELSDNKLKQITREIEIRVLKADEVKLEEQLAILKKRAYLLFGDPMVVDISYNTRYNKRRE